MTAFRTKMFLVFIFCFGFLHDFFFRKDETTQNNNLSSVKRIIRNLRITAQVWDPEILRTEILAITSDEEKSLFSLDSFLVMSWMDKRLKWNSSEFDGLKRLPLPDHAIWQPDIRVYNGHSSKIDPMNNVPVHLYSNGMVFWVPQGKIEAFCDVTTPVDSYPYDTHVCNITFGSWAHDGWQIDINIHLFDAMHWDIFSNTNPRWEVDIEKSKLYKVVEKYECCEEPYISIDAQFILKRRPPTEMRIVWVLSILVMILTLGMFWIPSSSGKKITLGTFLLVILTLLTIYCAGMSTSPRTPHLAVSFVQSTMIAVASAVVLEVIIINLSGLSGPRKPPDYLVRQLSGSLGDYLCICAPWKHYNPGDRMRLHEDTEEVDIEPTHKQKWLVISTSLDRILFFVYIVIFAVLQV